MRRTLLALTMLAACGHEATKPPEKPRQHGQVTLVLSNNSSHPANEVVI